MNWAIVWRFLVGSTLMFLAAALGGAAAEQGRRLYLRLGLHSVRRRSAAQAADASTSRAQARPTSAGAFIITLQLLAGAAGHILDVFFQKSRLDRKTIVATKAVTQVTGHRLPHRLLRLVRGDHRRRAFLWWAYVAAIALTFAGTSLAATSAARA